MKIRKISSTKLEINGEIAGLLKLAKKFSVDNKTMKKWLELSEKELVIQLEDARFRKKFNICSRSKIYRRGETWWTSRILADLVGIEINPAVSRLNRWIETGDDERLLAKKHKYSHASGKRFEIPVGELEPRRELSSIPDPTEIEKKLQNTGFWEYSREEALRRS